MKFKFKIQPYQTNAVESVVDCFSGQANLSGISYRIDPGKDKHYYKRTDSSDQENGLRNAPVQITPEQLLENIHAIQQRQNLPLSDKIVSSSACKINLDVEMETGTGKTYCYIKTIFEMNKRYGWTKFIVVVPSIAIREGVFKSLEITSDHFTESYGKKIRSFIYNSKQLHQLESFSSDAGINVMIINIQAFNASGKDNRRIYEELDDFQSRRPIDVICSNHPIVILDEPQKMEGKKTLEGLSKFKPLMILRYSATHRTTHNKIHRLDALDAYNQKLVKKIAVRGIAVKGLSGTNAYLYLDSIEISKKAPVASIEMEVRQSSGIKRLVKRLEKGANLFDHSNELDQYRGFVIAQIDAIHNTVEFTNGHVLTTGEATGDVTELMLRRIQIRETIKTHLDKEKELFPKGIKVLSLFFIDEVAKYRDYNQQDERGDYARIFEEEYEKLKAEYLCELACSNESYRKYLADISVAHTHKGYFSIDKKTKKLINPTYKLRGENEETSDDVEAYDLILKDKERLLSFEEPSRFIFSHSALREGWDNPNVFVMCMLKQSNSVISRRQEVGRGLRLSVNRNGDRMDRPETVHDINILTVIASESYKDFVMNLQREISDSLSARPRKADEDYFTGKRIMTETGHMEITKAIAKQIYKYLQKNEYVDNADNISKIYHTAKSSGTLAALPPELVPHADQIFELIDGVFSKTHLPEIGDDRNSKINPINANFDKKEFQGLWKRINHKAVYRVEFDSKELVCKCICSLDKDLKVPPLQYTIHAGIQSAQITDSQLKSGDGFQLKSTAVEEHKASIHSTVRYDLIGKLADKTQLTRKTIAEILSGIQTPTFNQFKQNPEHFIAEAARLINEQKSTVIIEHIRYDEIAECYDMDIFTDGQSRHEFNKEEQILKKHIYDYVITDSKVEKEFAKELDVSEEVVVYAKLPRGFLIPTPVGDYNPDWAISFVEGSVKHIYFVAETKGSISTMDFRDVEKMKIKCAREFFDEICRRINPESVTYEVIDSFGKLMELVGVRKAT